MTKKDELYETLFISLNDGNIKTEDQIRKRVNEIINWIENDYMVNGCIYKVEHDGEGNFQFNREMFNDEKVYLQETLDQLNKKNLVPRVGECIYGEDQGFYIKKICHYGSQVVFWVDEEENRNII